MTIRNNQSDRLSIFASGYAPLYVGISYERSEVEKSGYFVFILNREVAKTIREIQAQQKPITIHFPRYLDRLIIHDLIHLSGLVFVSYDELSEIYFASSSISLDGDVMQQISRKCVDDDNYKPVFEAHFWLVKQITNAFSQKIKNRVELSNSLLSGFGLLSSIGGSFSDASQAKFLIFLLTTIGLIVFIKRIQNFDILFYFKNFSLPSQSQIIERLKKADPLIILNEIRLELSQPELSQVIFIIGVIVPHTAIAQNAKNGLMLLISILICSIIFGGKWIKNRHFWFQFKQQLDQLPIYAKISSFLTKFDVTIFLLEMAIAAFLMGSLIEINFINDFINKINIGLNSLNREHTLLIAAIVGLLLISINLLNTQMPPFLTWLERWLKKLPNPIILKIVGYMLLLIVIIVEGFLLGRSLSSFLNYDGIVVIQIIMLTLMIMRLPQHFFNFLTKFFWQNLLSTLQ